MGRLFAVISGGEWPEREAVEEVLARAEAIIACDSGMLWDRQNDVFSQYLVGDMDSVDGETLAYFVHQGAQTERLSPYKDETDTEEGVALALHLGAEEIALIGGTGKRLDHSLGNLHVMYRLLKKDVPCVLEGREERVFCTRSSLPLLGMEGHTISVLPLFEDCQVSLHGFRYPLDHYDYRCGRTIGVSNVALENRAMVEIHQGSAFVFVNRVRIPDPQG